MDAIPSIADLRSSDREVSDRAWDAIYNRLSQEAMKVLSKALFGGKHEQDREDIALRAISQLWRGLVEKKLPSFNQIETFDDLLGVLRKIIRSRTIEYFRKSGREPKEIVEVASEPVLIVAAPAPPMAQEDFDSLLALLAPPKPEIFRLHYAEGLTAEEIAEKLGCPRGTVCCHLSRGKQVLREYLEKEGRGPKPAQSSSGAPLSP